MKRHHRRLSGLFLLVSLFGIEGRTLAQSRPAAATSAQRAEAPKGDAKADAARHFKRGLELFDDNDFQGALIEFQRAYQIAPTYQVLYNIGQVRYQLQDYAGALKSFEAFLSEGGDKVPSDRRTELERDIAKLRARVATVDITTARGATVYVDDVAVGTAPLSAPIQMSTGRRRIRATLAGSPPAEKTIELAGGDAARVDLPIEPPSSALPSPTAATDGAAGSSTPWALWGIAGVLAVGTAVTGTMALSASSSMSNIRSGGGSFADYDDARQRTRTLSIVTDIVGAAAILTVGIATYLTVASGKKSSTASHPLPILRAGMGPNGGSLGLTF